MQQDRRWAIVKNVRTLAQGYGNASFDVPGAVGKTVAAMRVYEAPPYGREVLLAFRDGTELVVELNIAISALAKHYRPHPGELETLGEWKDAPAQA